MERYKGKVAIVTGASAGIGFATAKALAEADLIVVGFARRVKRIENLAEQAKGKLFAVKVDVRNEEDILRGFKWTTDNLGPVYVLVNNAGVAAKTELIDGDTEKWKTVLDTNVLGVAIASREAIKIMIANNVDGHIININSIVGHKIINSPGINVYAASKHAITALTETLRLELIRLNSNIKITSLSPGLTDTEAFAVHNVSIALVQKHAGIQIALKSEDIANAITYILDTPSHVQVTEIKIQPVGEPY